MNGHQVKGQGGEKPKRLIVEFAIENAQVVQRRSEREGKAREAREKRVVEKAVKSKEEGGKQGVKRKRTGSDAKSEKVEKIEDQDEKNKVAKRNRIISKKRQQRRTRKG